MRAAIIAEHYATAGRSYAELEDVWRAFLSVPDIAVVVLRAEPDGQLRIIESNAAAQMYSTCPWHEAHGRTLDEIAIPEVRDYLASKVRIALETGEAQNYERAVDLPEGRVAWAANVIPVPTSCGSIREVVCTARPIPQAMHATGIEKRNRALVEGLNSTAPGLIYLYDPVARRANFVGGQVERLLGYKAYELEEMADPLVALIHPEDLSWVVKHIGEVVAHPCNKVSVFECRVRQRDGEYRLLACHNRVLDRSPDGLARTLIGVANDVTEQDQLKHEVELLADRLSSAQMDERRLIAQELHDSAGQYVVAAELALLGAHERLPELSKNPGVRQALGDVMDCLKDAEREIRVLSYLLHPPAIANQGLATVLTNFALGFGGRAGVSIDVSIDKKVNAVPNHLAIPLLRVCQEALTNVHRHAKASSVKVKLDVADSAIELEICDDGVGFSPRDAQGGFALGIGLSGMRERIERLGGSLHIDGDRGTCLKARIPRG